MRIGSQFKLHSKLIAVIQKG